MVWLLLVKVISLFCGISSLLCKRDLEFERQHSLAAESAMGWLRLVKIIGLFCRISSLLCKRDLGI